MPLSVYPSVHLTVVAPKSLKWPHIYLNIVHTAPNFAQLIVLRDICFFINICFFRFLWTIFARKISTQRKWPHIYTWILSNPNKIWHNCPLACCIEIDYYFFSVLIDFFIFVGLYNLFRAPKFFQFVHSCFLEYEGSGRGVLWIIMYENSVFWHDFC